MRKPIETWEQLQDKASSLIYTTGRLKQELADLKRYKHHLTGRSLDDQDKPRREEEVVAKQQELERAIIDFAHHNLMKYAKSLTPALQFGVPEHPTSKI